VWTLEEEKEEAGEGGEIDEEEEEEAPCGCAGKEEGVVAVVS